MTIGITFVSCFISLLEGRINPSLKLGTEKRKPEFREKRKTGEIISSNCLPHHKRSSSFTNKHEGPRLNFLPMLSRYRRMSESVHHDTHCSALQDCIKKPKIRGQKKNEELISSNCLPHHMRASSFTNKHKAARLHLLPMLSKYRRMSKSVHRDEQCSSLNAEGLREFWWDRNLTSYMANPCVWELLVWGDTVFFC